MKRRGYRGLLGVLLCLLLLAGCQTAEETQQDRSKETHEEQGAASQDAPMAEEENEIPKDGIITQEQMEAIAGKKGIFYFRGETADQIKYCWIYDGEKVQNPVEQRLLVECRTEGLEEIKERAGHAPFGMGIVLQTMQLAAPATLELTLTEAWDADRVLYCMCEGETVYQLSEATIETVKEGEKEVSKISFPVTQAEGKTYYLLGGTSGKAAQTQDTDSQDAKAKEEESAQETEEEEQWEVKETAFTEESHREENGEDVRAEEAHTCTISIECSAILEHWEDLRAAKEEFVPADGWILASSEVEFTPGETVFDVLKRVCKEADIHMSSRYTPIYGNYYIEGINQLYEFDCGEHSGWTYCINGWYPNYGSSSYAVEDGDVIEWQYTCELGSDVGNGYEE